MEETAEALRADILRRSTEWPAEQRGFRALGLTVIDMLDLCDVVLACSIQFSNCIFESGVDLRSSRVRSVVFINCEFKGPLILDYSVVHGSVELTSVRSRSPEAVSAKNCSIAGDLLVNGGCLFEGRVNFSYSNICGSAILGNAEFSMPRDVALICTDTKVGASVDCTQRFVCRGQWDACGMRVDGVFDLQGAYLLDPPMEARDANPIMIQGCSIYGDRLKVTGDIFFTSGFKAEGELRLLGAYIGGDLAFWDAHLSNPFDAGNALSLNNAVVKANVQLIENTTVEGRAQLISTDIDGQLQLTDSSFNQRKSLCAVTISQSRIQRGVEFAKCSVSGAMIFAHSEIGVLELGRHPRLQTCSLDLKQAHCVVLKDDAEAWNGYTEYDLTGFRYDARDENKRWTVERTLQWLAGAQRGRFSPQPYEQLARVQRQMGFEEDAVKVLIARSQRHALAEYDSSNPLKRSLYFLYGLFVEFGFRPARALNWAAGLWLCGTLFIAIANLHGAFYRAKEADGIITSAE